MATASIEYETFRRNLAIVIERRQISKTDLAKAAQIERRGIYKILDGEREPGLSIACRLADAVGVRLDDLRDPGMTAETLAAAIN